MISGEKLTTLTSDEDDDSTDFIVNWINALSSAENKAVKMQGEKSLPFLKNILKILS